MKSLSLVAFAALALALLPDASHANGFVRQRQRTVVVQQQVYAPPVVVQQAPAVRFVQRQQFYQAPAVQFAPQLAPADCYGAQAFAQPAFAPSYGASASFSFQRSTFRTPVLRQRTVIRSRGFFLR